MKDRVCGKRNKSCKHMITELKPFFEVEIKLETTEVKMKPDLVEIQGSINRAARAVLVCSK